LGFASVILGILTLAVKRNFVRIHATVNERSRLREAWKIISEIRFSLLRPRFSPSWRAL